MPSASKETASDKIAFDGLEIRLDNLDGGYSVCFETHTADADLAELFRGLPNDRPSSPAGATGPTPIGSAARDPEEERP